MPTSEQTSPRTNKAKILIHWERRTVTHTFAEVGSDEYRSLTMRGYVEVGEVKDTRPTKVFWKDEYFCPQDKYIRPAAPADEDADIRYNP